MLKKQELYFKNDIEWRNWLYENHTTSLGINLIFYKVENEEESMRWEEAVKVALCFGWIDSTVKSLGEGKRRQYFCPRNEKSVWSALNKKHIKELNAYNLIHKSGLEIIKKGNNNNFAPSYRKSYLYWLNQAKREATRKNRITEIIQLCVANKKSRGNW